MSNGTATQPQQEAPTREALQARREELLLLREVRNLEYFEREHRKSVAMESSAALFDYANFVDPREWLTDSFGHPLAALATTQAREEGRDRPFIETEYDLTEQRSIARLLVGTNPYLTGVLDDLTNYVIGTGFTYTSMGRRNRNASPALVSLVQDILDEFEDLNKWSGNYEREIFQRNTRDGEAPLRLHHVGYGQVKARVIEPEYITEPLSNIRELEEYLQRCHPALMDWDRDPSSWTFGVHTPERDIEDHLGYFVEWNQNGSDWDYIPSTDMVFMKSNVDRNVKRGISDFYPVGGFSDRALKLMRNIIGGATVQAAIAFIEQFEDGVTGAQIQSMQEAVKSYQLSEKTPSGGVKYHDVSTMGEGTKLALPKGRSYQAGPMGQSSAPVYLDVMQGALRAIGARWSMPEYMVSGDASNGSYSSSVEAGTPFVKACEARQFFYISNFRDMMWRVIRCAFQAGRFRGHVSSFQEIKRLVEIDVSAPDVEIRDPKTETERRQILFNNGVLSRKTWAARENEDYEQELENIRDDDNDGFDPTPNVIVGSATTVPAAPMQATPAPAARTVGEPAATAAGASPSFESAAKVLIGEIYSEAYP